jgi:hypothetical protein
LQIAAGSISLGSALRRHGEFLSRSLAGLE